LLYLLVSTLILPLCLLAKLTAVTSPLVTASTTKSYFIKLVIDHLRDEWYGNERLFANPDEQQKYHVLFKAPVDCKHLFDHCVENINTIAIPACQGIEGKIGALMEDRVAHVNHMDHMNLPIDILLLSIDDAVHAAKIALGNNGIIDDYEEEISLFK
jgi:hypothetical protein